MPKKEISIIYINQEIFNNFTLKSYLKAEVSKLGFRVELELFKDSFNLDILDKISSKYVIIFAKPNDIALISKILSTLLNDNLTLRDNILTPSKIKEYKDGSYLIKLNSQKINVVSLDKEEKINILLKPQKVEKLLSFFEDEASLQNFIEQFHKNPSITYYFEYPNILKLEFDKNQLTIKKKIESLTPKIIKRDSLIEALIEYLSANNKKITFAESCTGGALANRFISYSGASNIIDGSFITYSNDIKINWLGVKKETLENFGAVSSECVEEMAKGARERLKANIAISVSGIAGPTGAVEGKPVGTVYVCVDLEGIQRVKRLNLKGDRVFIQSQSVNWAIFLLIESLGDNFFDFFSKNP